MTDFLVIGGGIAGLSAGAWLSSLGSVTVLEAEDATGYHSSGRSAALFVADYGLPSTVALNLASHDYLRNSGGGYLTPRGLLLVAHATQHDRFLADAADLNLAPIPAAQAREMVPILSPKAVELAAYRDSARDIDTDRLMQDLARVIRSHGGQVLTRARVTAITRRGGGWQVETARGGGHDARQLVNAAGAWADEVAQLAGLPPIGIVSYRRSMVRLPAPGGQVVGTWPMVMGTGESWYAKPDAGKLLVSPAEEDAVAPQDAFTDDMVLAEGLARYQDMVTEPVTRVETSWAGLRSFAPDRSLVLGPDPVQHDFIWCAGQGGYGFQTAPAAAQLLADLISGLPSALPPDVVAALTPERLRQ
ncbi:NAD(P)/FAD-dependent oxidoreductase [Sedimentitalea sp. HM32M-2]|uniref:NAD(P)/FAD-dependent oxidoreductase n=1 Tax=Sedimentitalea sp. HM32M-2 TaxID=3351566 RepID=UPI00363C1E74